MNTKDRRKRRQHKTRCESTSGFMLFYYIKSKNKKELGNSS